MIFKILLVFILISAFSAEVPTSQNSLQDVNIPALPSYPPSLEFTQPPPPIDILPSNKLDTPNNPPSIPSSPVVPIPGNLNVEPVIKKEVKSPIPHDKNISIATGSPSGVYYRIGNTLCRLINKERAEFGSRCNIKATYGSIDNLQQLRNAEVDFAIVQSDWQENAFNGVDIFQPQGAFNNLRFVFSLHNEAFTVVVRKNSPIKVLDDIINNTVNIGPTGSGIRGNIDRIMRAKGWNYSNFKNATEYKPEEQSAMLCSGKIDVMILATGHPME